MKIGVMGASGSFSEQATLSYIQENNWQEAEVQLLVEINAVLEALEAREVDRVIFPIQNSVSGIVESSIRGMAEHAFTVLDLFEFEIDQNLLVLPGTTAAHITEITSQRPAIGQCTSYIERVWNGTPVTEYVDTAKAAADLANGTLPATTAVIASARCAEIYSLEILEGSIQDLKQNMTTFVVAQK